MSIVVKICMLPLLLLMMMASIFTDSVLVSGLVKFKYDPIRITKAESDARKAITSREWLDFTQWGIESYNQEKRLEANLVNANVIVQNGSLSHVQFLDTLPNAEAQRDNAVADKILKSGLYIYNSRCAPQGLEGDRCELIISDQDLPPSSELARECKNVIESREHTHSSLRRLLPRRYKDGFYQMFTNLPAPLDISRQFCCYTLTSNATKDISSSDNQRNLAVVQWAQFIENDLSKPVVKVMSNGSPIECCNTRNYRLQPRHYHPACVPLTSKDPADKYGQETCLNYVRSSLAVGKRCTFAAPEQLNQATGSLDMSPLYGFTEAASRRMRAGKDGLLKSSSSGRIQDDLLPLITKDRHHFCALHSGDAANATCFMAGDSRVNSNPFAIVIYTIFMRNHNRLANQLKLKYPLWTDEQLFESAKRINVDIYANIVFNEWLPIILGTRLATEVNSQQAATSNADEQQQISNEYAIAAARFYFSMLPDVLHSPTKETELKDSSSNSIDPERDIFILKDVFYNTKLDFTPTKVNDILDALLQQRAMQMDSVYVESLISDFMANKRPTHVDLLAFDIQRGRDHGLQPYYRYLEICNDVKIHNWRDLSKFMATETLEKLKNIYKNWQDIDLIVGGTSETPIADATVGPTLQCIVGEQFANLRQWYQRDILNESNETSMDISKYRSMKGADLLCLNSNLKFVPANIFQIPSDKNPLLPCKNLINQLFRTESTL